MVYSGGETFLKRKLSPPHTFFKEFEEFYNIKTIDRKRAVNRFFLFFNFVKIFSVKKFCKSYSRALAEALYSNNL